MALNGHSRVVASQVKNKTFFGMVKIFGEVLGDWTILREASLAIMEESRGLAP